MTLKYRQDNEYSYFATRKPLTDEELEILANEILFEDLHEDNKPDTDIESRVDETDLVDSNFDIAFQQAQKQKRYTYKW